MPLALLRLTGHSPQLMPIISVVPPVSYHQVKPRMSGSIADRLYIPMITAASGKNFICVSAGVLGGDGVAIAPLRSLLIAD